MLQVEAMKRRDLYRRDLLLQRIQDDTQRTYDMLAARSGLQVTPRTSLLGSIHCHLREQPPKHASSGSAAVRHHRACTALSNQLREAPL